jgi:hypothetical protein
MSTSAISSASQAVPTVAAISKSPNSQAKSKGSTGPSAAARSPSTASPAQVASAAVSAAVATLKEATETSAQTAHEAAGGDSQAQRLQAKVAAATTASSGGAPVGTRISVKA